ncbi:MULTISPECIES: hypothetical protein [unclassified Coleofasciculus]|uniref:hypothetical protein n=1 Tax=unclassified Coleofasciculus TaxID=2692782 RepID=UPI001880442A|nr:MULTISPECIES: hypothetical protein [unclassified Coleofasciculus]MBE9126795.1 hypothetical protein [Coleofasciculus sp. LEGE 07081]MBE9150166.1 hypothetical protein [Coleofasciculus sp. LEGE 07092]
MFYPIWRRCLLAIPVVLSILGSPAGVVARPASVFVPHLEQIQSNLPVGLAMRLPAELQLNNPLDIDKDQLVVRVFPSETPPSFTVSLFTCDRSPHSCLLGSFAVARQDFPSAQRDLQRHQTLGDRITLAPNVEGYLIEGPLQNPSYSFSTVMWEQNDMIYTISFPAIERQNILFMALSMAWEQPLYRRVSRRASIDFG